MLSGAIKTVPMLSVCCPVRQVFTVPFIVLALSFMWNLSCSSPPLADEGVAFVAEPIVLPPVNCRTSSFSASTCKSETSESCIWYGITTWVSISSLSKQQNTFLIFLVGRTILWCHFSMEWTWTKITFSWWPCIAFNLEFWLRLKQWFEQRA